MKQVWIIAVTTTVVFSHDYDKEKLEWMQYYRLGSVYSDNSNIGYTVYGRLKRTTTDTFRDIRFFGHFYNNNTEIKIRQKSSRKFLSLNKMYSFNTLIYEKNTFLNVNLRYHYNYGLGWFIQKNKTGNKTVELGVAFDNSDYLNTEQKTTYLRGGFSIDHKLYSLSTKFEIDCFYQVSEVLLSSYSLSRYQTLVEIEWIANNSVGIISGLTWDIQNDASNPSIFLTVSLKENINWIF